MSKKLIGQVLDFEKFKDSVASRESTGGVTGSVRVKVNDGTYQLKFDIRDQEFDRRIKASDTGKENWGEVIAATIARAMLITPEDPFEAAPEVSLIYDKDKKRTPIASKYLKGDKVRTLDDFVIKEQSDTKYTHAGNRHVKFVDGTKVKVKPGQYDISGEENKVLRQDIARGIAVSIITGDHDVNPGNFIVVTTNNVHRVARIDFGHAFNDLLNTVKIFGGRVRNNDNQVLDFLNREEVAGIKFGDIAKIWRDFPGMIPTQEMADAFKKLSQSTGIMKGLEVAQDNFLLLLKTMQENKDVEGIAHLKNTLIAINNNISLKQIDPDTVMTPERLINEVFESIKIFTLNNQKKMGDAGQLMQLQVDIDKMIEDKKRGYSVDLQMEEIKKQYSTLIKKPGIGLGKNKIRWIKTDAKIPAHEGNVESYIESRSKQLRENSKELTADQSKSERLSLQKNLEGKRTEKEKVANILKWTKKNIQILKDLTNKEEKTLLLELNRIFESLDSFYKEIKDSADNFDFDKFVATVDNAINSFVRDLNKISTVENKDKIKDICEILSKFGVYAGSQFNAKFEKILSDLQDKYKDVQLDMLAKPGELTESDHNALEAASNRYDEISEELEKPLSSSATLISDLSDKKLKVMNKLHELYQEKDKISNKNPVDKNLIDLNNDQIHMYHELYGKINQMLYFGRDMTGVYQSNDNLMTPLKLIFSHEIAENESKMPLENFAHQNMETFNPKEEWNNKPSIWASIFDRAARKDRHQKFEFQTSQEISDIFNKDIDSKHKVLEIRQLINQRKPNILQFWRNDERKRYEEMGLKAELLCLLDGFAKGEFCEIGLKNGMQAILEIYPNAENLNHVKTFLGYLGKLHQLNVTNDNTPSISLEKLLSNDLSQSAKVISVVSLKRPEAKLEDKQNVSAATDHSENTSEKAKAFTYQTSVLDSVVPAHFRISAGG